ncbi:MAG TPA: PaaI family thioesterase [Dermatophilaceae bacterium]|nr:PaaI family thioesterase [Dermatophilaceae bacterium]
MIDEIEPDLHRVLSADPLARHLGIEWELIRPGHARAGLTVDDRLLNPVGTGHGGAVMALIDVVHAAVSNSHGTLAVAQDVHTEFLAPSRRGDRLICDGVEVHRSTRTAVYRIEVTAEPADGGQGRLVATALARVFRLGTPWLSADSGSVPTSSQAPTPGHAHTG